jgi:hypothetical protein
MLNIYFIWALYTIPLEIEIENSGCDLFHVHHGTTKYIISCWSRPRKRRFCWGNLTFSPCLAKINVTVHASLLVISRYWIPAAANIVSKNLRLVIPSQKNSQKKTATNSFRFTAPACVHRVATALPSQMQALPLVPSSTQALWSSSFFNGACAASSTIRQARPPSLAKSRWPPPCRS